MKRKILVIALAVGLCQAAVHTMDQETLRNYLEKGASFDFTLIDVRTSEEIKAAIGNDTCKPYNLAWPTQFKAECERIPKDRAIIVYCQSGGRARSAATYLSDNGFANVYNAGGFSTWTGPTVPPSEVMPAQLIAEHAGCKAVDNAGFLLPAELGSRVSAAFAAVFTR